MRSTAPAHASCLLRLWREPAAPGAAWQIEVAHIQTGARLRPANLEAFGAFLQQHHPPGDDHDPYNPAP